MSMSIIHRFKSIEIGEDEREGVLLPSGALNLNTEVAEDGRAVPDAGQVVVSRSMAELFLNSEKSVFEFDDSGSGQQTGFQFNRFKWLDDVIVRPGFKAFGDVFLSAASSKQNNVRKSAGRTCSQFTTDLRAVFTWHHPVE